MKKGICIWLLILVFTGLVGCTKTDDTVKEDTVDYQVYYLNKNETKIEAKTIAVANASTVDTASELILKLQNAPKKTDLRAPLAGYGILESCNIDGEIIYLDFTEGYKNLSKTTEVLTRAAIVKTFTQIPGIKYVSFQVNGSPLADSLGNLVGFMTEDQFVDNEKNEFNPNEKMEITLYFANEAGDGLIEVRRDVDYNNTISLEEMVLEQIIYGTVGDATYPTMNPETGVLSVSVKDKVCYVDLDKAFLTQKYNVSPEVTVFSIVNSLVSLPNVNKVQISVEGKTNITYREKINFDTMFERNLDIISVGEK